MNAKEWMQKHIFATSFLAALVLLICGCGKAPHYTGSTDPGLNSGLPGGYNSNPPTQNTTNNGGPNPSSYVPPDNPIFPNPISFPQTGGPAPTTPSANYSFLLINASTIPPVVMNHDVYMHPEDPRSHLSTNPSVFTVQLTAVTPNGVATVQQLTINPPYAGQAQQVSPTQFQLTVATPGPIQLQASGSDGGGVFQVSTTLNIPRQVIAEWTEDENIPGAGTAVDQAAKDADMIICSNNSNQPVQIAVGGPGGPSGVTLTLGPGQQSVPGPVYFPTLLTVFGGVHGGAYSLTIPGNIPVGAVACFGIGLDCNPNGNPSCLDPMAHHFEQNFLIGNGQI